MGHVPAGPLPEERAGDDLPRRQHRGAGADSPALTLARRGEELAARFLERRGAVVLGRNVRAGRGEIDLIVRLGRRRVAVEVKSATGAEPLDNLTERKRRAVHRAARALDPPVHRVDLVTVTVRPAGVDFRWVRDV